jgi:hypothetical protein
LKGAAIILVESSYRNKTGGALEEIESYEELAKKMSAGIVLISKDFEVDDLKKCREML